MSHIWTFSRSSLPLLQRCIEAGLLQDTNNEWNRHFGRKSIQPLTEENKPSEKTTAEITETSPLPVEQEDPELSLAYDDFFDNLENEIRLESVIKECLKNPDIIRKMAHRLSSNTVEKLFNHVFTLKNVDNIFLNDLFYKFLPLYIKYQYSRLCIDLITKINEYYPKMFKKLLQIVLEDIDLTNQILNAYVATLDEQKLTSFAENLLELEISSQSFTHNILTIHTVYRGSKKTEKIQKYVETLLLQHSKACTLDKNYGKLFLAYLQNAKMLKHGISEELESCLEIHHSNFKRPCTILVKELVQSE